MKIVIDIPDDDYEFVKEQVDTEYCNDVRQINNRLYQIIANGTVLSKGHGRLIDADKLKDRCLYMCNDDTAIEGVEYVTKGMIENAPTVIEADKPVLLI